MSTLDNARKAVEETRRQNLEILEVPNSPIEGVLKELDKVIPYTETPESFGKAPTKEEK